MKFIVIYVIENIGTICIIDVTSIHDVTMLEEIYGTNGAENLLH